MNLASDNNEEKLVSLVLDRIPRPAAARCSLTLKIMKLVAAILVPLAIGGFTIVQSLQESHNTEIQRDIDQQSRLAEQFKLRLEEEQVNELRIQNIYEKLLTELQPIVRLANPSITEADLIFVRAKTFAAFEQIDARRKSYFVKFLYDSQLLFTGSTSVRSVNLDGVDLSRVQFGSNDSAAQRIDLRGIRLSHLNLRRASFFNVDLSNSTFEWSDLTECHFTRSTLRFVNLRSATVDHAAFIFADLRPSEIDGSQWRNATFRHSDVSTLNESWRNCDFTGSIFDHVHMPNFQIEDSIFDRAQFGHSSVFYQLRFSNVRMRDVLFEHFFCHAVLQRSTFNRFTDLHRSEFRFVSFRDVLFDHVDLSESRLRNFSAQKTAVFSSVNLLGAEIPSIDGMLIVNSLLSNGSFHTSVQLGGNLLLNGDAEEQCDNASLVNRTIPKWKSQDVERIFSNLSEGHCVFFGGVRHPLFPINLLEQIIDLANLSPLINLGQTEFSASALLGRVNSSEDQVSVDIEFRHRNASTIDKATIGEVFSRLVVDE